MPSDYSTDPNLAPPTDTKSKNKKLGIIAGVGVVIGIGVYLYARSKSSSSTSATNPNATVVLPSSTADSANSSVESTLLPYLQSIGASLNTLSQQLSQTKTGTSSNNIPPIGNTAVSNSYPVGTFGTQTASAAPYATGQTIIQGNPYTQFSFPVGTTQQTIATDLYGSAPTALATLQEYDPSGGTQFNLPVYPGEPVV